MYLLPSSLDQLKRSGRISTPQAIVASLLNINMLLRFQNGKAVVEEKIRTKARAKNRFFKIIEDAGETHQLKEIGVMQAGVKEMALHRNEELEDDNHELRVKTEA